eukprot:1156526-Pelagomonas_calceolata.AAC.5
MMSTTCGCRQMRKAPKALQASRQGREEAGARLVFQSLEATSMKAKEELKDGHSPQTTEITSAS